MEIENLQISTQVTAPQESQSTLGRMYQLPGNMRKGIVGKIGGMSVGIDLYRVGSGLPNHNSLSKEKKRFAFDAWSG